MDFGTFYHYKVHRMLLHRQLDDMIVWIVYLLVKTLIPLLQPVTCGTLICQYKDNGEGTSANCRDSLTLWHGAVYNVSKCEQACTDIEMCQGFTINNDWVSCALHMCDTYLSYDGNVRFEAKTCDTSDLNANCMYTSKGNGTKGNCSSIDDMYLQQSDLSLCYLACDYVNCRGVTISLFTHCGLYGCATFEYNGDQSSTFFNKGTCKDVMTEDFWANQGDMTYIPQSSFSNTINNVIGTCPLVTGEEITTSVESCQDMCRLYNNCHGLTYQKVEGEDFAMCKLHNCKKYSSSNNIVTMFYQRYWEPYCHFTKQNRRRGACPAMDEYSVVNDDLDCKIECSRTTGCLGISVQVVHVCYIHACPTSRIDQSKFQFYSKEDTGKFTMHGNGTTGNCIAIGNKTTVDSSTDCELRCLAEQDCNGFTIKYPEHRCFKHACTSSLEYNGEGNTFYPCYNEHKMPKAIDLHPECFYKYNGNGTTSACNGSLYQLVTLNIDECQSQCSLTWECLGLSYDVITSICSIFPCGEYKNDDPNGVGFFSKVCQDPACPYLEHEPNTAAGCSSPWKAEKIKQTEQCLLLCDSTPGCETALVNNMGMYCAFHKCNTYFNSTYSSREFISKAVDYVYRFKEFVRQRGGSHVIHEFQVDSSLNETETKEKCKSACVVNIYCESCSAAPNRTCLLHHGVESNADVDSTFYLKVSSSVITSYTMHGNYTTADCDKYDHLRTNRINVCKERCTNDVDCNGITVLYEYLQCVRYNCQTTISSRAFNNKRYYSRKCIESVASGQSVSTSMALPTSYDIYDYTTTVDNGINITIVTEIDYTSTGNKETEYPSTGNKETEYTSTGNTGTENTSTGNTGTEYTSTGNTGTEYTLAKNTGTEYTLAGNTGTGYTSTGTSGTGYTLAGNTGTGYTLAGNTGTGYTLAGNTGTGYILAGNTGTDYTSTGITGTGYTLTGNIGTDYRSTGNTGTGYTLAGNTGTGYILAGNTGTDYTSTGITGTEYRSTGNTGTGYTLTGNIGTDYRSTGNTETGYTSTGITGIEYTFAGNTGSEYRSTGNTGSEYTSTGNTGSEYTSTGNIGTDYRSTGNTETGYTSTGITGIEYTFAGSTGSEYRSTGNTGSEYTSTGNTGSEYTSTGNVGTEYTPTENIGTECTSTGNTGTEYRSTGNTGTGYTLTGNIGTDYPSTGITRTEYPSTGINGTEYTSTGITRTEYTFAGNTGTEYRSTGKTGSQYTSTGNTGTGYTSTGNTEIEYTSTGNTGTEYTSTGNTGTDYRSTGNTETEYTSTGNTETDYRSTGNTETGYTLTGNIGTDYRSTGNTETEYTSTGITGTEYTFAGNTGTEYRPTENTGTEYTSTVNTGSEYTSTGNIGTEYAPTENIGTEYTSTGITGTEYTSTGNTGTEYTSTGNTGTEYTSTGNTGMEYTSTWNTGTDYTSTGNTGTGYTSTANTGTDYTSTGNTGTDNTITGGIEIDYITDYNSISNYGTAQKRTTIESSMSGELKHSVNDVQYTWLSYETHVSGQGLLLDTLYSSVTYIYPDTQLTELHATPEYLSTETIQKNTDVISTSITENTQQIYNSLSSTNSSIFTSEIDMYASVQFSESPTTPNLLTNETLQFTGKFCNCTCIMQEDIPLTTLLNTLKEKVSIDKTKLSSRVRKLTSYPDERYASKAVGGVGVCVIVSVILVLGISDLFLFIPQLAQNFSKFIQR